MRFEKILPCDYCVNNGFAQKPQLFDKLLYIMGIAEKCEGERNRIVGDPVITDMTSDIQTGDTVVITEEIYSEVCSEDISRPFFCRETNTERLSAN